MCTARLLFDSVVLLHLPQAPLELFQALDVLPHHRRARRLPRLRARQQAKAAKQQSAGVSESTASQRKPMCPSLAGF